MILETARNVAAAILEADPDLGLAENLPIKQHLQLKKNETAWSKIS